MVAAVGVIFAALYLLWAYQRVFHGEPDEDNKKFREISLKEGAVLLPFLAAIVFMGVYPKPVLDRIEPSIDKLISHVEDHTDYVEPEPTIADRRGARSAGRGSTERRRRGGRVMLAQIDTFVGPEVGWFALSPMLTLLAGALGIMLLGALTPRWPNGWYALFSAITAGTAGAFAMVQWDDITDNGPTTLVGGAIAFDTLAMFLTITICVALLLVSLLSDAHLRGTPNDGPELYALYMVAAIGGLVMASANDLIVLFLGLETLSLALYVLAASNRRSSQSAEAGLKYFVLGGFSSAFFLYGIALVYGATGSTNISEMVVAMQTTVEIDNPNTLALAGIALLMVGLGFKVAAAPFHVWVPDVYQGSPSPVTAFMASAGKAAAFAAMLRVLVDRAAVLPQRLAPGRLGAGAAVAARRVVPRRRADEREAHARLLVGEPRRLHPRRCRSGRPSGRQRSTPALACRPSWCTSCSTACSSSDRSAWSPSSPARPAATRASTRSRV